MTGRWLTALLLALALTAPLTGKLRIFDLPSIDYIDHFVEPGCLVAFDVGHTLIEGAASWGHARSFRHAIEEGLAAGLSAEEAIAAFFPKWVEAQRWCPHKTVETHTVAVLERLRRRGVMMMGLTHRPVEAAAPTVDQLLRVGIDFEADAVYPEPMELPLTPPAAYLEGVLFCSYYHNKGAVLLRFIAEAGLLPVSIAVVDDNRERLVDIVATLEEAGLSAYGLHYLFPARHPTSWDAAAAARQERLQGSVLSDEEAALLP